MHDPLRARDPADVVVAWEAVEELLAVVPEGTAKDVLRCTAAGLTESQIADRLGLDVDELRVHAARARVRILTAAMSQTAADPRPHDPSGSRTPQH